MNERLGRISNLDIKFLTCRDVDVHYSCENSRSPIFSHLCGRSFAMASPSVVYHQQLCLQEPALKTGNVLEVQLWVQRVSNGEWQVTTDARIQLDSLSCMISRVDVNSPKFPPTKRVEISKVESCVSK